MSDTMNEPGIYAPLTWTAEELVKDKSVENTVTVEPETKIYIVEAISMFRMRYAVRCQSAEHAMDTVTMNEAEEMSQHHLQEVISSARAVTESEYLELYDQDNDYLSSWPAEKKLSYIHEVDYKQK
jgi:hypothetical protein